MALLLIIFQMITIEKRSVPAINVVTRSGATTQVQNTGKQPVEAWVHKTPEKIPSFDVEREKETFIEAQKDFAEPRKSVATTQQHQQQASSDQVSTLSSFLQSCIKLLRNQNALNEL